MGIRFSPRHIKRNFAIDSRSLALFRIFMGLSMLWDAVSRFQDIQSLYSSRGVLAFSKNALGPEPLVARLLEATPFFWGESAGFYHVMFGFYSVVGACTAVGYKTRLVSCLGWLFLISLQARAPTVLCGGDQFLRLFSFWLMFLPAGLTWSLDAHLARRSGSALICTAATFCTLLQLVLAYVLTALLKAGPDWRADGRAIEYSLSLETLRSPFGAFIYASFPASVFRALTPIVLLIEEFVPLVALITSARSKARGLMASIMIAFHLGLGLAFQFGAFQFIVIGCWMLFIPEPFFNRLAPSTQSPSWPGHPFASKLLIGVAFFSILAINFEQKVASYLGPQAWRWVSFPGRLLRLHQHWGLFAPQVMTEEGTIVVSARLKDGTTRDLWAAWLSEKGFTRPLSFPSFHWRHHIQLLYFNRRPEQVDSISRWLTAWWNMQSSQNPVSSISIEFLIFDRRKPTDAPPTRVSLKDEVD